MADARLFCNGCGQENNAQASFCVRCGASLPGAPAGVASGMAVPAYGNRYGGFWLRVLAYILDSVVMQIVMMPVVFLFLGGMFLGPMRELQEHPGAPPPPAFFAGILLVAGISFALHLVYEAWLTSSSWQATIGKKVVQLKVTDLQGNRLTFPHAAGRFLAKIVSGIILGIGYLMVGFTERKQGLHDMIAGTLVQKQ
jgi:uncharacterized RDD family membrane protein YckC